MVYTYDQAVKAMDKQNSKQQTDTSPPFERQRKPPREWIQCVSKTCEGHVFKGSRIPSHCNKCGNAFPIPDDVPFEHLVPNQHLIQIRGRPKEPRPKGKGKGNDRQRTPPAREATPGDGEKLLGELLPHVPADVARPIALSPGLKLKPPPKPQLT